MKLMTVGETADMLGRTPQAIYHLIARRKIPFRKDGRRIFFIEEELQTFIEALPGIGVEELLKQEHGGRL
jgi:excisionase family DNA binding protein